jgi:hypothetical protein
MIFLKIIIYIVSTSLSLCVLAADNIDNNAESGRNFKINKISDSTIKQDCFNELGKEKLLSENERQNDKTLIGSKKSRLNQIRNRETENYLKSKDMRSKDMRSKDMRSKDMKSKDTQPNESNTIKSINSSLETSN